MLDGLALNQWGPGTGLLDLPVHRLFNWLTFKALETCVWDENGKAHAELADALEWPEIAEVNELERSDAQARAALHALGLPVPEAGFLGMLPNGTG